MKDLPQKFYDKLKTIHSQEEYNQIVSWLKTPKRQVSFRLNTLLWNGKDLIELDTKNIKYIKFDKIKNCYLLEKNLKEKDLWETELFKTWKIYLQSISSQIPVNFLNLEKNQKILDATAAPWWKTSQIRAIINNTWEIIANDNNSIRIDKLNYLLKKLWVNNTKVIKNDAAKLSKIFKKETFDHILADLPCSAEWRINLNIEKTFWFWSEENTLKNQKLQKEILKDIIPLLKKWWSLVYSTCTLTKEENEDIVDFILSNFKEMKEENIILNLKYTKKWINNLWIRVLPSEITEWFYLAKFTKIW